VKVTVPLLIFGASVPFCLTVGTYPKFFSIHTTHRIYNSVCCGKVCIIYFALVYCNAHLKADFPTRALVADGSAQLGIEYACGHLCMYVQGGPAHWNLTCRSKTGPPPVLSPSSILPPPSSCAFAPAWKNSARFQQKCYYFRFFSLVLKLSETVQL